MNVIEGLNIQGFVLDTRVNYNSIPGLKGWRDARYRITLETGVNSWGDFSPEGNTFSQSTDLRQPAWIDNYKVRSVPNAIAAQVDFLRSPRRDYTFLHNRTGRWGYYFIAIPQVPNASTTVLSWQVLSTCEFNAGQHGIVITIQDNATAGNCAIQYRTRNGGVETGSGNSNVIVGGNNALGSFGIFYKAIATGGNIFYYNNSIHRTQNTTITDGTDNEHDYFHLSKSSSTGGGELMFELLYDWTGYSQAEAEAFDLLVRTQLELTKAEFALLP